MPFLATLLFWLLASSPCQAAGTITIAADDWPPYADPRHPQGGFTLELLQTIYHEQGYRLQVLYLPWARAMQGVKSGEYDLLPNAWLTSERQQYLAYSDSYAVSRIVFIKRRGDPFDFQGLASLRGKTVGTIRGYGYGDAFLGSSLFTRQEGNSLLQNISKLTHREPRLDLTLDDELVARANLAHNDPSLLTQIAFTTTPLSANPLHITCSLANPRRQELITAFNRGLQRMRQDGRYQRLCASYGMPAAAVSSAAPVPADGH